MTRITWTNKKGVVEEGIQQHRMLKFGLHANTTSTDIDMEDNIMLMEVKVVVEADILVRGDSDPRQVYYGDFVRCESAMRCEREIGPNVLHTYEGLLDWVQ